MPNHIIHLKKALNSVGRGLTTLITGAMFFLVAVAGAEAAVTNVSPGESLQSAIDNAEAGDTIQLESGTYRTSEDPEDDEISIDKDLTIIGAGRDATFIQAHDSKDSASHRVFKIQGADVAFQDLTVRYGKESDDFGGGIHQSQGSLTLENCAVKGQRYRGGR